MVILKTFTSWSWIKAALDLCQQMAALDDKKPPARRVTLSPAFQSESEEESENNASENESDVDIGFQSAAATQT